MCFDFFFHSRHFFSFQYLSRIGNPIAIYSSNIITKTNFKKLYLSFCFIFPCNFEKLLRIQSVFEEKDPKCLFYFLFSLSLTSNFFLVLKYLT